MSSRDEEKEAYIESASLNDRQSGTRYNKEHHDLCVHDYYSSQERERKKGWYPELIKPMIKSIAIDVVLIAIRAFTTRTTPVF